MLFIVQLTVCCWRNEHKHKPIPEIKNKIYLLEYDLCITLNNNNHNSNNNTDKNNNNNNYDNTCNWHCE